MTFPVSPANNETATVNGITYVYSSATNSWARTTATSLTLAANLTANKVFTSTGVFWSGNGAAYAAGGGGSGITYTASTSPPGSPAIGDQWYDTAEGILYEYIDDGDTSQWVDIVSPTFSGASPVAFNSNITVEGNILIGDGIYWSANGDPYSSGGGGGSFSGEDTVLRANVGAFQIYANTQFTSYSNTNVSAYLTQGANIGSGSTTANLVAAATTESINSTTGALVVRGGAGIAGNLYAQGTVVLGNGLTSNVVVAAQIGSSSINTGALVVKGGAGINQSLNVGLNVYSQTFQSTSGVVSYSSSTGALNLPSGAGAGITGNLFVDGNVILGSGTSSNLVANATTTSSSTTTGALVVRGGMGVAGAAYIGGLARVTNSTASTNSGTGALQVAGGVGISGALNVGTTGTFSSSQASTDSTSGALIVAGGVGIGGALNVASSGSFGGLLQTTATTAATSTATGALYVAGGAGIVGNLYAGGNVVLGSSTTTSNVIINGTRTSTSTTTGALRVAGGAGIAGNVYTDRVYTTTGIFWSGNNAIFAPPSSPIFSSNVVAASDTPTSSTTTGALVVRGGAGISGSLRVGSEIYVSDNINVTNSAYIGEVRIDSTVNSTNLTNGALRIPNGGGVSVTGNIHTRKLYTLEGLYWSGNGQPFTVEASNTYGSNLVAASGTASVSTTTGALVVAGTGGLGVGGDLNTNAGSTVAGWTVGGLLWAACTTPATSATSGGGLLVNGGARILGNIYASGNIYLGANTSSNLVANATTTSTSTTTGALVVRGGAGVAGNLYVGSEFVIPGGGKITSSGIANFLEKANVVVSAPADTINVDLSVASVMYWTSNSTTNMTANIRGDETTPLNTVLSVGQSVTTALFIPNGVSNYYINSFKIDNTTVTPAYSGNSSPTLGNPNSIDIYSFTILKTADATFKVFATQSQFQHPG